MIENRSDHDEREVSDQFLSYTRPLARAKRNEVCWLHNHTVWGNEALGFELGSLVPVDIGRVELKVVENDYGAFAYGEAWKKT